MSDIALAAARLLTRVAAVFLFAMMGLTVVDVGLRAAVNAPIFGTYEIIEFLLAAVAFLAIPEVFLRDGHITIELIDQVVSQKVVDWLRALGTLAALVFVTLLTWHMIGPALDRIEFNDVTIDLQLPLIWRVAPILLGVACSIIAALVVFRRDLLRALGRQR